MLKAIVGQISLRIIAIGLHVLGLGLAPIALPAAQFGLFVMLSGAAQLICAASVSWLNQGTLKFAREEFNRTSEISQTLSSRLCLQFALVCIAAALFVLLIPIVAESLKLEGATEIAIALVAGLIVLPLAEVGLIAMQARGNFLVYGTSSIVARIGPLVAVSAMLAGAIDATWENLYALWLMGCAGGAIVTFSANPSPVGWRFVHAVNVSNLLKFSKLLPLASIAAYLIANMDFWFITIFLDATSAGAYAWVYGISMLASNLLVPVAAVIAPTAIDATQDRSASALEAMADGYKACIAIVSICMPVSIVALWLALNCLDLGTYNVAVPSALVLLAGTIFQLSMALSEPIMFSDRRLVRVAVGAAVAAACANAILDCIFVPAFGLVGAAIATAGAFAVGSLFHLWVMRQRLSLPQFPLPITVALAGIAPTIAALAIPKISISTGVVAAVITTVLLASEFRRLGWLIPVSRLLTSKILNSKSERVISWLLVGSSKRLG